MDSAQLRKELLKLNKAELVKKCKSKKVKTYGSKAELVNRLVEYQERKPRKTRALRKRSKSMQLNISFKNDKPATRRRASVTSIDTRNLSNKANKRNVDVEKLLKPHTKSKRPKTPKPKSSRMKSQQKKRRVKINWDDEKATKSKPESPIVKTHKQLLSMGFPDQLASSLSNKFKGDINKCLKPLVSKYISDEADEDSKDDVTVSSRLNRSHTYKCDSKEAILDDNEVCDRIIELLDIYNKWMNESNKKSIYSTVCEYYSSMNEFFKDYNHLVNNMDDSKIYRKYKRKCPMQTCLCLRRNYRNTCELSKASGKRLKLYYGFKDEEEIVVMQFLDVIHNYIYHIIDCGLRYCDQIDEKQEMKDRSDISDNYLKKIKFTIKNRRAKFERIFGSEGSSKYNKFVTNLNIDLNTLNTPNAKYITFSSGIKFYYHQRYKNMNSKNEKISGTNFIDDGNLGYIMSEWYIEPKYMNLKTEILNSEKFVFSVNQWRNTVLKAKLKWNEHRTYINKASPILYKQYGFDDNSSIEMKHILCLLLYTNFDYLCEKFIASFRKSIEKHKVLLDETMDNDDDSKETSPNVYTSQWLVETDDKLKEKHSYYANWAKKLKECVEIFGSTLNKSKYKQFYRGINVKVVFNDLSARLCGPTSTSIVQEVAINSVVDGIILSMHNDKSEVNYFNCIPFSDFPGEGEILFMTGFGSLQIVGLKDMSIVKNYDQYIRAIKVFERCVQGMVSIHKVNDLYYNQIRQLVYGRISPKRSNSNIPKYGVDIFNHLCDSLYSIQIDSGMFEKDLLGYGYNALFSIFFRSLHSESDKWINLRLFNKLLPQIKGIVIKNVMTMPKVSNKCAWCESLMINDFILEDIHEVLSTWKLKLGISIFKPLNNTMSLQLLINEHMDKFLKIGYNLQIIEGKHERYGEYYALSILSKVEAKEKRISNQWKELLRCIR